MCLLLAIISAEPLCAAQGDAWQRRIGNRAIIELFPTSDLYPAYIAAPRQPRFSLRFISAIRRDIPHTPRSRLGTAAGASLGLFRLFPPERPDRSFQLQMAAGTFAQWEKQGRDGIGWDGVYQIAGTWTWGEKLAFKLGIDHISSHVVDEYIENTSRRRLNYTREEVDVGASYAPHANGRFYAEMGYAHLQRSALQRPWRVQAGVECVGPERLWAGRLGWFVAGDVQARQENDWRPALAAQVGVQLVQASLGRSYRIGVEFYDGHSPLGEFFQARERHVALGWWLDF